MCWATAFYTAEEIQCFTRLPQFPDELATIQVARGAFRDVARAARDEGISYLGGCCGCDAACIRALAQGLAEGASAA